jgi:hypothetical protein
MFRIIIQHREDQILKLFAAAAQNSPYLSWTILYTNTSNLPVVNAYFYGKFIAYDVFKRSNIAFVCIRMV